MTKKNPRVHRETLPADLAGALLNVPFEAEAESQPENFASVGVRFHAAREELAAAVQAANVVLAANPLMEIIAEHAARQSGRRGHPIVVVDPSGEVLLEVHYLSAGEAPPTPTQPKKRKSKLPPIAELRREATVLGIDIEPFGKNKKNLIAAIEAAKAGGAVPAPKAEPPKPEKKAEPKKVEPPEPEKPESKMTKTAPALSQRTVRLDGEKIIPVDDDDDDLADLFDDDPPAPPKPEPESAPAVEATTTTLPRRRVPRRGTPAGADKAPAPTRQGRKLSAIAGNAEAEVDIDAILAKKPPAIPDEDD
jgi:hypothetical protein